MPGLFFLSFKLAFSFQVLQECLPLWGTALAVGLHALVVGKLRGIAVVEIVAAIVDDLAVGLSAAEHEVVEHLATDETDAGGPAGKEELTIEIKVDARQEGNLFA